jgi:hypothetical protein
MWHCIISLWLAGSGPFHPYGTVTFPGGAFESHALCASFARGFIKSETHARPAHRATFSCTYKDMPK